MAKKWHKEIEIFCSSSIVLLSLIMLLGYPLIFSAPRAGGMSGNILGVPRVANGDEPHYLLAINSFIRDFDFDLSNNYLAALKGDNQAGAVFSKKLLDHHTVWYDGNQRIEWQKKWGVHPSESTWQQIGQEQHPEYPTHPIGFAMLIGTILLPLRWVPSLIEPGTIMLMNIIALLAAVQLFKIAKFFDDNRIRNICFVVAVITLTPFWHYSRALYGEGALSLFFLIATMQFLENNYIACGLSIGLALLIKPTMAIAILPYVIYLLLHRNVVSCLSLCSPILFASMIFLLSNYYLFGSILRMPQEFQAGNMIDGLLGLWFSLTKGIMGTAPVVLFLLPFWKKYIQKYGVNTLLVLCSGLSYVIVMSFWRDWQGGTCYGPRLIVPVIPIFMLPFTYVWKNHCSKNHLVMYSFIVVVAGSFLVNLASVTPYWRASWNHPFVVISKMGFS